MKKTEIRIDNIRAGILSEESDGFVFVYDEGYTGESVSVSMPVQTEPYRYASFPPFFDGLLPEGMLLDALLRVAKLDRYDYLAQLIEVGADVIGNATVHPAND